jgi:hypothetical protein
MATRDELKLLIDQLPAGRLEPVMQMLSHHVNPRIPDPKIMRVQREGQDYKKLVMKRFHETRKPGTISTGSGSGFSGMHEGTPFGRHSFSYWDEKALIHQTLQSFDGQSIELMNRLSFSEDRTRLSFSLEVSSGGKTGTRMISWSRCPK